MQAIFDLESIRTKLLEEKQEWENTKAEARRNAKKDRPVSMLP